MNKTLIQRVVAETCGDVCDRRSNMICSLRNWFVSKYEDFGTAS